MGKKALKSEIAALNEKLQLTEEQLEVLENTSNLNLQMTEYHLGKVKETTGEILMEDVTYCVNLGKRILAKLSQDFNEKTETETEVGGW